MKLTMKHILLGLGSIGAVTAPVAAVVACGSTKDEPTKGPKVETNTTGTTTAQQPVTQTATNPAVTGPSPLVLTGSLSSSKLSWHHMFAISGNPTQGDHVIIQAGQQLELTIGQDKIVYVLKDTDITAMNNLLKTNPMNQSFANHQEFVELVANMIRGAHTLRETMLAMGFEEHHPSAKHFVVPK